MRTIILSFLSVSLWAQTAQFNVINVVPTPAGTPGGATAGRINLEDVTRTVVGAISVLPSGPFSGYPWINSNFLVAGAEVVQGGSLILESTGDSIMSIQGSALGGGASLLLSGNASSNCWNSKSASGSSLVVGYTNSCGGVYSLTTEVTYTPSGVTFAQPITVPSCTGCAAGSVTSFNTRVGAVVLSSSDVSTAGGNGSFAVTSTSDASLAAVANLFSTASLLLHGNSGTNCWDQGAGTGSSFTFKYTNSCTGGYSPVTEVTFTPAGTTFAQPITVPSCTGCGSGVTSIATTSPISGGTITSTGTISCPTCVTSVGASGLLSSSGGTTPSITCSTCVASGSSPTFANITISTAGAIALSSTGSFSVPGWNYLNPGPGNWTAGTYYQGTNAGASCSAGTVNLLTLTISGGIVTSC